MSSRAKISFAWLWIAALLTATVGVSMQRIYCYCAGNTTVSFFTVHDACAEKERPAAGDCCQKPSPQPVPSCCEKDDRGRCSDEQQHDGCMHKSTKVFQLKTEFVVDQPFEKTFDCPLWIEKMPMFRRYFRPAVCKAFPCSQPQPPPLSGRDICLRLQTFRC